MVREELDPDYEYEDKIFEFQRCFEAVHQAHGLSETLKVKLQITIYKRGGL